MSMYQSRASSPDKDLANSMVMTKASSAFKASGRKTTANWANRFNKDFNDLDYDIKYNLIKGKSELIGESKRRDRNLGRAQSSQSRKQASGVSMDKYKNRFQLMQMNKTLNPQQYHIEEDKKYSTLDSQGLCKFEFQKTIGGRLIHKSNHHMNFQYQTERSKNIDPVWYNAKRDLLMEKMMKTMKKNKIKKCHDFGSYTPRKVFTPKEELDKFYDTKRPHTRATSITVKETVRIDQISGRKDPQAKITSRLSYNDQQAKKRIMRRAASYQISKGKRQLQFSRQVISAGRGCYR